MNEDFKSAYDLLARVRLTINNPLMIDFVNELSNLLSYIQEDYVLIKKDNLKKLVKDNLTIKDDEFIEKVKNIEFQITSALKVTESELKIMGDKELIKEIMVNKVIKDLERI